MALSQPARPLLDTTNSRRQGCDARRDATRGVLSSSLNISAGMCDRTKNFLDEPKRSHVPPPPDAGPCILLPLLLSTYRKRIVP